MAGHPDQQTHLPPFDLLHSPLSGTSLIEASAGTGKTYTISGLFLRLILEKQYAVDQILVVTFTVAATEELRDRIRSTLRQAVEAFRKGDSPDPFLKGLVGKISNVSRALRDLEEALNSFDEATITTIHGFCQQTLQEHAFESGSPFDTELIVDQKELTKEIVLDFWRRHFYEAHPAFFAYAESRKVSPGTFLKLLGNHLVHPDLKIVPQGRPGCLDTLPDLCRDFDRLKARWPQVRAEVLEKVQDPSLKYYSNFRIFIDAMDRYLADPNTPLPLFEKFEKFTASHLQHQTKKKGRTPTHPFFDLCEAFHITAREVMAEMDQQLLFLKGELFRWLKAELPARKNRLNLQSFDDLLTRLRTALSHAGGEHLGASVRDKFRAALIDEFQDTDPVQYEIFKKLFDRKESLLFLVGDPKQAIYSFRGADLFAYMKAADQADSRYTLRENWRSEPALIRAVNTLFSQNRAPFLFEAIPFIPAKAGDSPRRSLLQVGKESDPPFRLWLAGPGEGADPGKPISKTRAREGITRGVAGEISRLLNAGREGRALIGGLPLRESDLAVLVRTHREARLIQEALTALRIPCVLYSLGNIFDTREAAAIERILAAAAEPNQETLLKAALTTDLLGWNGEELHDLMEKEGEWENWLFRFRAYGEVWERQGFIRMFRTFLTREKVRERLLAYPDGERRLTNVLHLSEVLHQTAMEKKLGMTGMIQWLRQQRDPETPRLEEHQLRLESDAEAVRIVTIHKSKGLEYPVVFCPFNWSGSQIKTNEPFLFHDGLDEDRLNLVLDPEGHPHRWDAEREILSENLRLLYVALTRAKNRCYLVWGRIREAETSAPAYLLHPPETSGAEVVSATGEHFKHLTEDQIRQELTVLAEKSGGAIALSDLPESLGEIQEPIQEAREALAFQPFSGVVRRDWQVTSFSSLTAGREKEAEGAGSGSADLPDYDQGAAAEEIFPEEEPAGLLAFPKGAKAGVFLHSLLEQIDFAQRNDGTLETITADLLQVYGFERPWTAAVCTMIRRLVSAPLGKEDPVLRLAGISRQDRLNELEFYFPLKSLTPARLARMFTSSAGPAVNGTFPERLGRLDFAPARGFMKGFIDLVFRFQGRFFLVDWKSNFLGPREEDYHSRTLQREMEKNYYLLQYHLYVLALHQYLKNRLPDYDYDRHFGGVFYLFLRGINPEKGSELGIFQDRPARERIEALSRELIDSSPSALGGFRDGIDRRGER